MRGKELSRALARYLFTFSLILLLPLFLAVLYEFFLDSSLHPQPHSSKAFFFTFLISSALTAIFHAFARGATATLTRKESIFSVVLIWFLSAAISSLPFAFSKTLESPLDAYFESISGLTSTGASMVYPKAYDAYHNEIPITLQNGASFYGTVAPITAQGVTYTGIEAVGKAILFWRSFLQWLGGMGIVVLFVAVLPALSMGGKFLFETEVSGPTKETMTPRIKETASLLWKIYLGFTLCEVILLIITTPSLPIFDAITLSFSTISTGGFTIRNDGLAAYGNTVRWISAIFMIIGSINFSLYIHCIRGKIYKLYEPELRVFFVMLLGSSCLVALNLWQHASLSFGQAFAEGAFQAISAQTSTGFATARYDFWPYASQTLLLILMFIGGMAGSTSGGLKVIRPTLLFRVLINKVESVFRPETVRCLKIGEREISDKTALSVLTYFCLLISFAVLGTFLLILDGLDFQNALATISTMTNNGGLSFGFAGTSGSYAFLSPLSKVISILWMMLGRLEFFALLVLFVPAFWRR